MKKKSKELGLFRGGAALGFDAEEALRHLPSRDPKLGALIERVGPFRLQLAGIHSPFAALTEAILHQQLTGKAAATILGRFKALFPGRPNGFPRPEDVARAPEDLLRGAGLSRAKAMAVKDLAAKSLDGTVPSVERLLEMDEEAIVERLCAVRGVGRWTVEMLLIFRLGRPDVLPIGDYGIRKGFARAFRTRELPTPAQVERRGQRWRPYRTVASWYLWRALELPE